MSPFPPPPWRLLPPLLAVLALAAGCGRPGEPPAAELRHLHDLVAELPAAEILQPVTLIDFDDPASRQRMLSGWSFPTRRGGTAESSAVWSQDVAELDFLIDHLIDLKLHLRCSPADGAIRPALALAVNGQPWRRLELATEPTTYSSLRLPVELLQRGLNQLRITYLAADGEASPADGHRVRWKWIRFRPDPERPSPQPRVHAQRKTLFIPTGTRLDYFLELPRNSVLRVGKLHPRGETAGRLQVRWHGAGGEESVLAEVPSGTFDLLLPASGGHGRLSLFALGNGPEAGRSDGFLAFRPAVYTLAATPIADREAEPEADVETAAGPPAGRRRPHVVLYLIDTLRADHLGCYGYPLDTSPRIDRFAERAALFDNAQAQSPWTRSSVASMLTGLLPQVHGANDDDDALAPGIVTLAEFLRQAGYRTLAVSGNGNAGETPGFDQGFDVFDHLRYPRGPGTVPRSSELNARVFPLLAEHDPDQPLFLFVHTVDPHAPYDPPQPFRDRFAATVEDPELGSVERMLAVKRQGVIPEQLIADLLALYDAEIAANDASFGALLDALEARDLYDDSLIILVSDHGEEFYDHGGWTHGRTLHAEMLDTPLIVKLPGMEDGSRIPVLAQHIDLLPTVADVLGLEVRETVHGRSLLPALRGVAPAAGGERALAHFDLRGWTFTSLIDGSWKIIQSRQDDHDTFPELYDRRRDPREQVNLAAEHPGFARLLAAVRRAEEAAAGEAIDSPKIDISDKLKMRQELKALGYLQ